MSVAVASRQGSMLCGKWQVGKLLGAGGMSAVFDAMHRNGHRVAIKMLNHELCLNPRARQRFLREGYIANRVDHPGAVKVLDDGIADDGTVFLVMELLHGQTLGERLRELGPLPLEHVLACADRALDILAAAHEVDIVHRDVKPDNLFLTSDGTLKLLDFGIASVRELSHGRNATLRDAVLGTPAYMAPEQARGRADQIDARTDLWALGATMFELLTGRHVHEAASRNEVLIAAATKSAPSLADACPNLDAWVVELVDRALALEPKDRWSDARAMQRVLRDHAGGRTLVMPLPSRVACSRDMTAATIPQTETSTRTDGTSVLGHSTTPRQHSVKRGAALIATAVTIATMSWVSFVRPLSGATAGQEASVHRATAVSPGESPSPGDLANPIREPSGVAPATPSGAISAAEHADVASVSTSRSASRGPKETHRRHGSSMPTSNTTHPPVDVLDRRE